ncbi:MAG: hypothetical protein GXC73_15545 [Chitinophagaceae bacterium]|nr:hypothetical protein [Chitinophagaceae bacterium]
MKGYAVLILCFLFQKVNAQVGSDSSCTCVIQHISANYPKVAEEKGLSGTVIIEYTQNENWIISDPVIIKKAGNGFDEEAMRVFNIYMLRHNACYRNCKLKIDKKKYLRKYVFNPTVE